MPVNPSSRLPLAGEGLGEGGRRGRHTRATIGETFFAGRA